MLYDKFMRYIYMNENPSRERTARVNIGHLECYLTAIRCGNYANAARELYVTPQAVSKAISELEKDLSIKLCEKSDGRLEPTRFGRVFTTRATELLASYEDLRTLAKKQDDIQRQEGSVSIAITHSLCRGNIIGPEAFTDFEKAYPSIVLKTNYRESGSCLSAVKEGAVDAAIIVGRTNDTDLVCTKIYSTVPHLLLSNRHRLANKSVICLKDTRRMAFAEPEDLRYARGVLVDSFRMRGLSPRFFPLESSTEKHEEWICKRKGGIIVFPDPQFEEMYPDSVAIPFSQDDIMPLPFCLVSRRDNTNSALPSLERYIYNAATRIKRKQV